MFQRPIKPPCFIARLGRCATSWYEWWGSNTAGCRNISGSFFLLCGGGRKWTCVKKRQHVALNSSCDSQGAWTRFPRQVAAARSVTSRFCDRCAGWTNNAGCIHNLGRTARSLSKAVRRVGQLMRVARWAAVVAIGSADVPLLVCVIPCSLANAACSLCKVRSAQIVSWEW